ncbi:carcinoembryonic antigen-related cell adhesion molecule 20-like [Xyrauchen texanus]|uniref:carcinoembryonic antigen-related cell adhesion molecule 20-like n=1 Tax=Xyrauchen texanus TaxID=154827 RepID=UPI002242BE3D|nr:carcinoembryonic antigen-related cell adhesion molecule 20-like [Xyrauchen texanus]
MAPEDSPPPPDSPALPDGHGELEFWPAAGAVGEKVLLAPVSAPSPPFVAIEWSFGSVDTIIRVLPNGNLILGKGYEDRISLNQTTLSLELRNLTLTDSGNYRLSVFTESESAAGETLLYVFERISGARLIGPTELLIEDESSANVTSEGTGTITSVLWMKDNNPLSPSNNINFSSDNRSVLINPVRRSDSGEYQCTLRNPASYETAKLSLTINYGPEDVRINGQNEVGLGDPVSLSCSGNSVPPATFTWKFNGTNTTVTTDKYTINETDFTHSGEYICTAWNYVTNRHVSQIHNLIVKVGGGGGGLTTGEIIGIVIGVLAVACICGLTVYLIKTKKIPKLSLGRSGPPSGEPQSRQEPDLNYTDMSHIQKRENGKRVIQGNMRESSVEYAEINTGVQTSQGPGRQVPKPSS